MNNRLELFRALQEGATLITPNNRLAAELLDAYCQTEFTGQGFLKKPHCLPYQTYLQKLFRTLEHQHPKNDYPILLTKAQERFLWTDIIASTQHNHILNPGLIDEVMEAWRRCKRWQVEITQAIFKQTPQSTQFQAWAQTFQNRLSRLSAISEEELVPFFLKENISIPGTEIIWYCFEDYNPSQLSFQQYLNQGGSTQSFLDLKPPSDTENAALYEAPDEEQEQHQLILWVKDRVQRKDTSIGVIVPDLQNKGEALQRLLQQKIPEAVFNISLGKPLRDFPILSHALTWLRLNPHNLRRKEAEMLLYSPFLAFSKLEKIERLQSLQDCLALEEEQIDMTLFLEALRTQCPKLVQMLLLIEDYPEQASVLGWIEIFKTRLQILGFPGEQSLTSENYQCYLRFLALFDEFKELGFVTPHMSKESALHSLETLSATSIFQAKTDKGTIQVLGLLEATGCVFDSVWVSNMTNECLPQKTRLSAFIPPHLQIKREMPHASTNRELTLALKILERLKNSSPRCVFSYPRLTKDKPNLPSPLLDALPPYTPLFVTEKIPFEFDALETYEECYQLPLTTDETIRGGTNLIANQAKCPFRSFAAHRLHIRRGLEVSDGLNTIERGKIIHKVMEDLWRDLKNQQNLLMLSEKELDNLLLAIIKNALEPYRKSRPHSFPPLVQEVEVTRLQTLIKAALAWEKTRPAFEVEGVEQTFSFEIAGLAFQLRLDRLDRCIDETHFGDKTVIDYKSSLPGRLPWNEERPTAPQLLMYALLDERINTLLFVSLKEGHVHVKGLSEEALETAGISQIKKDQEWNALREDWEQQITTLVQEYQQGQCLPQPVNPGICQQCDFASLCRFGFDENVPPTTT